MCPSCLVQPQPLSGILAVQLAGGYQPQHTSFVVLDPTAVNSNTTAEEARHLAFASPAESTTYVIVLMPPLTKGSGH